MAVQSHILEITLLVILGLRLSNLQEIIDPKQTLECHRRAYSYKVTQADPEGRLCWGIINVMSCWGRCDSNEISDWKFPYKKSYHPVCIHNERETRTEILKNCEEGVAPGTEIHEYLEAVSCRCHFCKSSEASCEGLSYRGQRSVEGFIRG